MERTTDDDIKDFYKTITSKIIRDVNAHIRKADTGLLVDFQEVYKETTSIIQIMRDDFNVLSKRMKKIIDSTSLYEDVYKMRDELIEIKKMLKKLSDGR
jgi:hypothetical protein